MKKVLYEELLPEEFVQRMQEMPVAYLPLGTLESAAGTGTDSFRFELFCEISLPHLFATISCNFMFSSMFRA